MTSQPGPSSHQVFIAGMHLEQRARHPFAPDTQGTAGTIRVEFLVWRLGNRSDSHIVNFARVQQMVKWVSSAFSRMEEREGPTPVARKHRQKFLIGTTKPNEETWVSPPELSGAFIVHKRYKMQETGVSQGLYWFTATDQLLDSLHLL